LRARRRWCRGHNSTPRAARLVEQFRAERAAEYGELCREAERFLEHIRHETAHRDFTFAELEELEEDLGKLTRWAAQVRAREYFAVEEARQLAALLDHCDAELATFLEAAARQEAVPQ
jgi:hypothetical protein